MTLEMDVDEGTRVAGKTERDDAGESKGHNKGYPTTPEIYPRRKLQRLEFAAKVLAP